jgi:hypothetical protein
LEGQKAKPSGKGRPDGWGIIHDEPQGPSPMTHAYLPQQGSQVSQQSFLAKRRFRRPGLAHGSQQGSQHEVSHLGASQQTGSQQSFLANSRLSNPGLQQGSQHGSHALQSPAEALESQRPQVTTDMAANKQIRLIKRVS